MAWVCASPNDPKHSDAQTELAANGSRVLKVALITNTPSTWGEWDACVMARHNDFYPRFHRKIVEWMLVVLPLRGAYDVLKVIVLGRP